MHLRGPMNVSQLAVYQVPSEASKMRKRNTVSFSGRRRALKQRGSDTTEERHSDESNHLLSFDKRKRATTTDCSSTHTVTSTMIVANCGESSVGALPNTNYIGTPLPCLPTPAIQPTRVTPLNMPIAQSPSPDCTCSSPTIITEIFERHPTAVMDPMPSYSSNTIIEEPEVRRRDVAWERVAYYTSTAPAQATGFSFLANLGDPRQSGTFD